MHQYMVIVIELEIFFLTVRILIGYFEVTQHLTMLVCTFSLFSCLHVCIREILVVT